ncbi:unnamed protein product (macronuclear) [Paramecium tetraurelia]|uniref:Uncharacterized protein n=1 Tax=Paramecium tetraurelia TaxID=5888 RepID=A0CHC8_PARTE|nr:uncharacterized protein GSPATT00038297001 [Paramecium tetraurelia]CAK70195.1 unnamed protein product [Paramecium tetraurelia]|eukprot:XP_001437592.1 hypothetical protein (macronuclear) [Paramecium tetraurelia strain d4-2]
MFDEDYYRRLIVQSSNQSMRTINTDRPWYPKMKQKPAVRPLFSEDFKFFVLPPNKMISLLKRHKITIPTDEQIREFLRNHSLKNIVNYGVKLQSSTEIKVHPPSVIIQNPRKRANTKQQININKKTMNILPIRNVTEPSKHSTSQYKPSCHKTFRMYRSDYCDKDVYGMLKKLNFSPMQMDESPRQTKENTNFNTLPSQTYVKPIVPKSVLPYPPRSKKQLRQLLLRAINKIKKLGLTIKYVMQNKIFSKKPYEKPLSKQFIHAAKKNEIDEVSNFLSINPYLVFDFDFYNMTALHWACKKGYVQLVELLLQYHSDVDGVDILYRTPLILSIEENHLEITHILLAHGAYPWSTAITDLKTVLESNEKAKNLLTKVRRLQIMAKWTQQKDYLSLI